MVSRRTSAAVRRALTASLSIALLGTILGNAAPAFAQPADVKLRAESTYREGLDLAKAGKNEAALKKFEESYASLPTGKASFQIAQMERALGRYKAALHDFREALADSALSTDERRATEAAIEELKQQIGIITFDVPAGSTVTVDGIAVDAKTPVEVVAGAHEVRIHLGADSRSAKVTCIAGKVSVAKLRFDDPNDNPGPTVLPPTEERSRWSTGKKVTVGVTSVASVGLVVTSAVLYALANGAGKASGADSCSGGGSLPVNCLQLKEDRDAYDSQRGMSTAFFYSGVGLAVVAVATAIFWPNQRFTVGSGADKSGFNNLTIRF